VYFDRVQNIDFVAGIMSFLGREAEPYCAKAYVDYFTRVGTFANWIFVRIFLFEYYIGFLLLCRLLTKH
jgi:hypothetical protein